MNEAKNEATKVSGFTLPINDTLPPEIRTAIFHIQTTTRWTIDKSTVKVHHAGLQIWSAIVVSTYTWETGETVKRHFAALFRGHRDLALPIEALGSIAAWCSDIVKGTEEEEV